VKNTDADPVIFLHQCAALCSALTQSHVRFTSNWHNLKLCLFTPKLWEVNV